MRILLVILLFIYPKCFFAQDKSNNKYGLHILYSEEQLEKSIQEDSNKSFVRVKDFVPDVVLDIKYATEQNAFYEKLYDQPYAFIRLPVAKALAAVQQDLKQFNAGLKIYDAYRPYNITCRMFERIPDTIYMGKPWKGSKHNRGISVDLTLVDLKTREELPMPTPYDYLGYVAHPDFMGLPDSVIRNRELLISAMTKYGFTVSKNEWWHFDYAAGASYEILDISHRKLKKLIMKKRQK